MKDSFLFFSCRCSSRRDISPSRKSAKSFQLKISNIPTRSVPLQAIVQYIVTETSVATMAFDNNVAFSSKPRSDFVGNFAFPFRRWLGERALRKIEINFGEGEERGSINCRRPRDTGQESYTFITTLLCNSPLVFIVVPHNSSASRLAKVI